MEQLPVDQAGSSGVGRQQPDDEGYLQLIVEREPARQTQGLSFDHPSLRISGGSSYGPGVFGTLEWPCDAQQIPNLPGQGRVGDGLHHGVQSEDDPVHHPPDLQGDRTDRLSRRTLYRKHYL